VATLLSSPSCENLCLRTHAAFANRNFNDVAHLYLTRVVNELGTGKYCCLIVIYFRRSTSSM